MGELLCSLVGFLRIVFVSGWLTTKILKLVIDRLGRIRMPTKRVACLERLRDDDDGRGKLWKWEALLEIRLLWEGRVVVIAFLQVLKFDIPATFR